MALGNTLQPAQQKIVDALPGMPFVDGDLFDANARCLRRNRCDRRFVFRALAARRAGLFGWIGLAWHFGYNAISLIYKAGLLISP